MLNGLLVFLSFLMALVGGTGAYELSPLFINLLYLAGLASFLWIQLQHYHRNGAESIRFDFNKCIVFVLYLGLLLAFFLRETQIDSDYQFLAHGGVIRNYTDLFRGLVVFLIVSVTYEPVKNSKAFVILPLLCLIIILIGIFLESYQIINFNSDVHEGDQFEITTDNKLLARPGGFLNANATAALATLWLYIALESKITTSITIKGLAIILTLTICLFTQSRAVILFLVMYTVFQLIVLRNAKFLISIVFVCLFLIVASYYFEFDIAYDLLDKFSSRVDSNESNAQSRGSLIIYAFNSLCDAPIFGNGIYYVAKSEGHGDSAHNQILELLTNFGIFGFIIVSVFYWTFYHKNYFSYLTLCIFPTLFFSHNFFESSPFQVALAFAYNSLYKEEIRKSLTR